MRSLMMNSIADIYCAPIRVKIRSTGLKRMYEAGTKHPVWARMMLTATWRKRVLFPPMLGPVMILHCANKQRKGKAYLHLHPV